MKTRMNGRGWFRQMLAVGAVCALIVPARGANPDGDLRIELISSYNLIVDSNAGTPSSYAPSAVYLGATFHNDGTNALTNVWAYMGVYR